MFYLGHNNRVPYLSLVFKVLCTVRYKHCEIKADISNIHTHEFLLKCKNHLILPIGPIKIAEKTIKTLSWNYLSVIFQLL